MSALEVFLAIAGTVVAFASPAAAYFGARYGHKTAVKTAEVAAEATRDGYQSAERIAAQTRQNEVAAIRQDAFWRAVMLLKESDAESKKLGLDLLTGLLDSNRLDEEFQHMALSAVGGINRDTVNSLRASGNDNLAGADAEEDAG